MGHMRAFLKQWRAWLATPPPQVSTFSQSSWLFRAMGALGGLGALLWIKLFGVNIWFLDEWDVLPWLQSWQAGEPLWPGLWSQHNEHRLLWVRSLFYALSQSPIFDLRWVMGLGQVLLWLTFGPLVKAFPSKNFQQVWGALWLALLFLSPVHHVNQLWAFQFQWYGIWAGCVLTTWALSRPNLDQTRFAWALLGALLAYGSASAGLMVWLHGGLLLGIRTLSEKSAWRWGALWSLLFGLALFGYFWGYQKPASHPSLWSFGEHPFQFIFFFLTLLGKVFGTEYAPFSALIGASGLGLLAWLMGKQRLQGQLLAWGLMQFGLIFTLGVALGRSGFGMSQALASHYALMTMTFWVGLAIVVAQEKRLGAICWGISLLLLALTANKAWHDQQKEYRNRLRGQACYHAVLRASPEAIVPDMLPYRDCKFLFPDRAEVIRRILILEKLGIRFALDDSSEQRSPSSFNEGLSFRR